MGVETGTTLWAILAGVRDWSGLYLLNILSDEDGVGEMLSIRGSVRWGARICVKRIARVAVRDDFLGLFG